MFKTSFKKKHKYIRSDIIIIKMAKKYENILLTSFIILILLFFIFNPAFGIFGKTIRKVDTEENIVFLTFDDGPSENTVRVLEILDEENISATFFLTGNNVKKYPDISSQITKTGHGIGIHSMTHPYIYFNTTQEITDSKILIEEKTNSETILFRPAYGILSPWNYKGLKELNLKIILWDVFPRDYNQNSEQIISYIDKNTEKGSIIVLHDGLGNREETIKALPEIINNIRTKGYDFALLEDYI
jgi:chitin deacetylase